MLFRMSFLVGFVLIAILLERVIFCEQFRFHMMIDGNIFEWNVYVQRREGSMNFDLIQY